MNNSGYVRVVGDMGPIGRVERAALEAGSEEIVLLIDDGTTMRLPRRRLVRESDEVYRITMNSGEIRKHATSGSESAAATSGEQLVVPVVAETLNVSKRTVETGKVRVTRQVTEREEIVEEPLLREEVTVERVTIDRPVDGPVAIRQEGDTTIIPVVEEVLVIEKRLVLKEEIRITRRSHQEVFREQVTLRTEEPVIERVSADGNGEAPRVRSRYSEEDDRPGDDG